MTSHTTTLLPKRYHEAVTRWREAFIPDYKLLLDEWDRFFPRDPRFELCAFRECGMCSVIECGDRQGQPKYTRACDMDPTQAHHLLGAVRAQASTEFGSIQQHQLTLARAQEEQDQFWVLRMMAEELRHGYQMLHVLLEDDWSSVSKQSGAEMVEDILSMTTGTHILGAFNIDFDSFLDNIVFCALIDRVGKYQLAMQKISAYAPMAESMPKMLQEEAFHLATGVVPMRRWVTQAAAGDVYVSMDAMQRSINKWLPRGMEMFGDERGGATNVKYGLKPMKNAEAQQQYWDEVKRLIDDLNLRYIRARVPSLTGDDAQALYTRVMASGTAEQSVRREDLLHTPHALYFRRRGVPAYTMVGFEGETYTDIATYLRHLEATLPQAHLASSDFKFYVDLLRKVVAGEMDVPTASQKTPGLRRVGGVCPCSRSVRWVTGEEAVLA